MPKYFFHVTDGAHLYEDMDGQRCNDSEDATECAVDIARDLANERTYESYWVDVRDEFGKRVVRVDVATRH
jgi:hypothetical protein